MKLQSWCFLRCSQHKCLLNNVIRGKKIDDFLFPSASLLINNSHYNQFRFNSATFNYLKKNTFPFATSINLPLFSSTTPYRKLNYDHKSHRSPDHLAGSLSSYFVSLLPTDIRPFAQLMRLDKPTGIFLLLMPCWWSLALSAQAGSLPSLSTMTLFGVGAVLMRSAGCIINDIWDRKFDRNVQRTHMRPLASNQIPLIDAVALLASLLGSSLLVLINFDYKSILLGASSLILVVSYPLFKRFTYWSQLILGMTFNWGILLGWSVNTGGDLNFQVVLPLYMAGICWTMIYDTIYAHQDKLDDLILGLKSTALKFGHKTPKYLHGFTTLMTTCLLTVGLSTDQIWPYYLSLAYIFCDLTRINNRLDIDSAESCAHAFRKNTRIGWILLLGIITSTWLKKTKQDEPKDKQEQYQHQK